MRAPRRNVDGMSLTHRPHFTVAPSPAIVGRVPRWGHLSRSVSHYGTVSCVLAIYPPDSSDAERRLAEANRLYAPLAFGGSVVAWVALCAVDVPPLLAAIALAAVLLPFGILLSRRSRDIRHRTVTLSSSRSGLGEDTAEESAQRRRLDTLAEALEDAAVALRQGIEDREGFDRVWRAVYAHAAAGSVTGRAH